MPPVALFLLAGCVLSGLAPGTPRRWGLGASSTPERLELGFHLGESSVPPVPTTVTSACSQLLLHFLQGVLHGQWGRPVLPDVLLSSPR